MNRDQAIAWLRSVGRNASARDWSLGASILITVGEPTTHDEIKIYPGVVYLFPTDDGAWSLLDCDLPNPAESYANLESALQGVHAYITRKEHDRRQKAGDSPSAISISFRLLLVVEDTFAISGRGLVIAPDVELGDGGQRKLSVELRRPDGTVLHAEALAQVPFVNPPRPRGERLKHVLLFAHLGKTDVPIGTELWIADEQGAD